MILSPLTQQLFQLNFCFLWSRVLNRSVPGLGAGGEAAALAFPAARLLRRGRGPHLKSPLMGAQRYLVSGKQILVLSTQSITGSTSVQSRIGAGPSWAGVSITC